MYDVTMIQSWTTHSGIKRNGQHIQIENGAKKLAVVLFHFSHTISAPFVFKCFYNCFLVWWRVWLWEGLSGKGEASWWHSLGSRGKLELAWAGFWDNTGVLIILKGSQWRCNQALLLWEPYQETTIDNPMHILHYAQQLDQGQHSCFQLN